MEKIAMSVGNHNKKDQSGFTLLEVILALSVMGLLATALSLSPRLNTQSPSQTLLAALTERIEVLSQKALFHGDVFRIKSNKQGRQIIADGFSDLVVPKEIEVRLTGLALGNDGNAFIAFFADSTNSGGTLTIEDHQATSEITLSKDGSVNIRHVAKPSLDEGVPR